MLTYSQQQLCLQMKTNHKQDTDMLSPLAFFFFPTRFCFFSSFYSFPLFPSYDFVCSPRHCENNRWGTSWWCVFLCVRAQWVCLIEMLIGSNETSAIMWLQTRFPNKRRMLSVASRVFHWNHTFIQPVSCPGVFLSAWADEEREPSVSLSCSLLFPLSLSPPSPHPSSHPFHHPPPSLIGWGQLMWAIAALTFFLSVGSCYSASGVKKSTWLTKWVRPILAYCWGNGGGLGGKVSFSGCYRKHTHTHAPNTHLCAHTAE